MKLSKVTTNGRVTLPAELRKKYKLIPGRKIRFEVEQDGIKITPLVTPEQIRTNVGFLGTNGKLLRALIKAKKIEREL